MYLIWSYLRMSFPFYSSKGVTFEDDSVSFNEKDEQKMGYGGLFYVVQRVFPHSTEETMRNFIQEWRYQSLDLNLGHSESFT
jgi:hypothetical protein